MSNRVILASVFCLTVLAANVVARAAPDTGSAPGLDAERPPAGTDPAARPAEAATPATPASPTAEADKTKAKALFAEGSKQFKAGRFDEAIATFEKAFALWENPKILVNIAICHHERARPRKAVEVLRSALAKAPPEGRQALRDLTPEALRKADADAAELRVQMPETADVEVGGSPEGKTPVTLILMPGSYEVVIKMAGVEKVKKTVQLAAAAKEEWILSSWPVAGAATREPPVEAEKPPTTEAKPGFWARMRKLQTLPIWYFGAAAALAVVGGITIVGTGVKTNQLEDDFWDHPTHATRDEGIRYRSATNAMVGITVTALVGAAVLALFTDWKNPLGKRERQVEVLPQVGNGGAGLVLSGGF